MFSFVFSNWFCATGTQLSSAEAGAVVLGDAVPRRGAVAGAIQRSATVFTPVVPASWLELALPSSFDVHSGQPQWARMGTGIRI